MTTRNAEALAVIAGKHIGATAIELGDLLNRLPRLNTSDLAAQAPHDLLIAIGALRAARDAMLNLETIAALPPHRFAADNLEIIPPGSPLIPRGPQ